MPGFTLRSASFLTLQHRGFCGLTRSATTSHPQQQHVPTGTLGTVWYILRKKEYTGELCNTKLPGHPQKKTLVDDHRIFFMLKNKTKQNHFTTFRQMKNILQEVGISLSKSTIKRRLHESKHTEFPTRCKLFINLKKRRARLDFAKKYRKK